MYKINFNFIHSYKKKKSLIDGGLRKVKKKNNRYFLL